MPILIHRANGKYLVSVSPPEGQAWQASSPMSVSEVFDKLTDLGCHTTDISDAFYAADPVWTQHENED